MRYLVLLVLGMLVLGPLAGCGGAGPLVGAWELVRSGPESEAGEAVPELAHPVKILSEDRFAFGQRNIDGPLVAGGGTYVYRDGIYVERVEYHWMPALIGLSLTFEARVEGDLWYHKGTFDIAGKRLAIDEVWRRID